LRRFEDEAVSGSLDTAFGRRCLIDEEKANTGKGMAFDWRHFRDEEKAGSGLDEDEENKVGIAFGFSRFAIIPG
jgi:hypothetical protein